MRRVDIFALLEKDHKEATSQLEDIIARCEEGKSVSFDKVMKVREELELHTQIEEKHLYPKAQKEKKASNLITDAYQEHQEVKDLLKELKADLDPSELATCCQQILDCVEHHVEEEENELFPILREAWDKETLLELGEKAQEMKEKALSGQ